MRRWGSALAASLVIIGLFAAVSGPAAFAAVNGKLVVTVYEVNEDGERSLLPGAQVILSDKDGQFPPSGQTTNAQGQTTFGVVPAGKDYVVTVKFPGFATTRRDGVQVFADQTSQLAIAVTPERVEEVEVKGREQVIELEKGGQTETEVSGEFFQDLPVQGRDYQNILELAAGVQDLDDDGNPNVHGARSTEFQMNVDGVSNVDPLTGQSQSRINADAIEEMRIVDSGADASYGGAAGGYGEIITKEGGNEFDGTFNFFFRDDAFDNDRAGGGDPLDFGVIRPSVYVSGPVVKDHLWYMASHELVDQQTPIDLIGAADFVQDFNQLINRDKLTWQVTPKNKLQLQFSSDPLDVEPLAVSAVAPPETGVTYERSGPTFSLNWTSPFSPTFFWEATVAYSNINIEYEPTVRGNPNTCISVDPDLNGDGFVSPQERNTFLQRFQFGGPDLWNTMMCEEADRGNYRSGTYFQDYNDDRNRWTYAVDAEQYISDWLGGQHRLKFGLNVQQTEFSRFLWQRDRLQSALNPLEIAKQFEIGGSGQDAAIGTIAQQRFFPTRSSNTARGDVYALYIDDSYEPLPNLRINVGLRIEREELRSDGFEPIDPAGERRDWMRFLLGSGMSPDDPARDACFLSWIDAQPGLSADAYLTPSGEPGSLPRRAKLENGARAIDACRQMFLTENSTIVSPANTGWGFELDKVGSFTYQNPVREYEIVPGIFRDLALNPQIDSDLDALSDGLDRGFYEGITLRSRARDNYRITNNNIAPRVSVAWDPWDDGKTKLSANWGRYYQNTFLQPLVDELGPFTSTAVFPVTAQNDLAVSGNPSWGSNDVTVGGTAALSINQVDRELERQYTDEYGIGVEREIAPETTLRVRYLNRRFEDKLQDVDVNRRPVTKERADRLLTDNFRELLECETIVQNGVEYADCSGQIRRTDSGLFLPASDGRIDLERLSPAYNQVYEIGNFNSATYEAYIVELERRYYRNWELRASYTWSEALGQAEEYNQALGDDLTNSDDEFGPLSYDIRHQVKVSGRVLVPWYGGIRLGGFLSYRTGTPYSIIERQVVPDFWQFLSDGVLPAIGDDSPSERARPDLVSTIRTRFPTGQRNDQRNPPVWNLDLNVQKEFMIRDMRATVQFDIFNVLNDNTQQTALVVRNVIPESRDTPRQVIDTPIAQRRTGRSFQLAFKLDF